MEINGSFVSVRISVLGIPTRDAHFTRDLGMGIPKTRGDTQITVTAALGNLMLQTSSAFLSNFKS